MKPSVALGADLGRILSVTRQRKIHLQVSPTDGLTYQAPAGSITPDLKAQLAAHKPALVAYLKQVEGTPWPPAPESARPSDRAQEPACAAVRLRSAIVTARDWEDLERLLEAVQAAYERDEVDQGQAPRTWRCWPPG